MNNPFKEKIVLLVSIKISHLPNFPRRPTTQTTHLIQFLGSGEDSQVLAENIFGRMSNLFAWQKYLSILTRFTWKSPNHTFATRCIRALGSFVVSLIQTSATERYQPLSPSCLGLDMKIWKSRGAKIMAKLGWTQTMLWSGSPTQHPPTLCGKAWDETFDKVRCKNPNYKILGP